MAATRGTRLLIVGVALLVLISLMFISIDPEVQYTVDEVMASPNEFTSEEVHLRGTVLEGSVDGESKIFILQGSNEESRIFIDISSVALPDGFAEGYVIAVKGDLIEQDGKWTISANSIQTGCPSKYDAE
ncbi:MAG: cytochrome c maturation protein CcmE domain-containing protein [Candidatus Poseidoniales archaeon]|jgi:cytochrome c-type biogenesis protein CcmE|tara:strand:+ start:528 stop:917 length:390 start_codon:yes stop_codon:yes gene_type:complete